MKLKRETYRHIEAEIRDFDETLKLINQMELDILYAGRQEQEVVVSGGFCTSQTERRGTLLADSLLLREMRRIGKAIGDTWSGSTDDVKSVVWVKYGLLIDDWEPPLGVVGMMAGLRREDLSHSRMAEICCFDERTWYRNRAKFVYKVAERLGWY